ncbi:MAG TPA: hypothetical protein DFR83_27445, partial [Deltaproteobacteria bacterium]|nr:hypothetical protein [Deltaproteobacteria bacterium]
HHVYDGLLSARLTEEGLTLTATTEGTLGVAIEPSVVPFWPYRSRTVGHGGEPTLWRAASAGLSNPIGVDPDGRLLTLWTNAEVWHAFDLRRFLVLSDPNESVFWVPDGLCRPEDSGLGVFRVMHVDGALWLLGATADSRRFVLRRVSTVQ